MNTDEFCKECERFMEVWERLSVSIVKAAEEIRKIFNKLGNSEKVIYKRVWTKRVESQCCKKYNYIPVARKNLPYQRRKY